MITCALVTPAVPSMRGANAAYTASTENSANVWSTALSFGGLRQLAGTAGCLSSSATETACTTTGRALGYPRGLVVSPDDKHVYVGSFGDDGVAALSRNSSTGALTQLATTAGCITETGSGGCTDGKSLTSVYNVAISPDGANVYTASNGSDAVAVLNRNATTGALSQAADTTGCYSEDGTKVQGSFTCANGVALIAPEGIAVSPDNKHVYVASFGSNAVAVFSRNTSTGELTQLAGTTACVSEAGVGGCTVGRALSGASRVNVSPDGAHVYVSSQLSNSVAIFSRNATTGALTQAAGVAGCISASGTSGTCTVVTALLRATGVIVSPDDAHVYVTAGDATSRPLTVYSRNPTTGALTQAPGTAGCFTATGDSGACSIDAALSGVALPGISPDGKDVYVPAAGNSILSVYTRDAATGWLTHTAGPTGCFHPTGNGGLCTPANGIKNVYRVVVAPDGKDVYAAGDTSASIAVFNRNR